MNDELARGEVANPEDLNLSTPMYPPIQENIQKFHELAKQLSDLKRDTVIELGNLIKQIDQCFDVLPTVMDAQNAAETKEKLVDQLRALVDKHDKNPAKEPKTASAQPKTKKKNAKPISLTDQQQDDYVKETLSKFENNTATEKKIVAGIAGTHNLPSLKPRHIKDGLERNATSSENPADKRQKLWTLNS